MRVVTEALVLALVLAAGTWMGGWWAVPMGAAVWGLFRGPHRAWMAGLAAGLAWGGLLLTLPIGPLYRVAGRLGAVFSLPGPALLGLALLYAVLLGWSAARLAGALQR